MTILFPAFFLFFLCLAVWDNLQPASRPSGPSDKRFAFCALLWFLMTALGIVVIVVFAARAERRALVERYAGWMLFFGFPALLFLRARVCRRWLVADLLRRPVVTGRRRYLLVAGLLAGMLLFSAGWLQVAAQFLGARMHASLAEQLPGMGEMLAPPQAFAWLVPIFLAPFFEEVAFRGYILERVHGPFAAGFSDKGGLAISIVICAFVWSLGHGGVIEPDWIKHVQIFGVGLFLGVARWLTGLGGAVALHLGFNLLGGFFVPDSILPA